nr:spermatogenesis-associated protein 31E1-like [Equus caballus]
MEPLEDAVHAASPALSPAPLTEHPPPPPGCTSGGAHSKATSVTVLRKPPQPPAGEKQNRLQTPESLPSLALPLPAPSPAWEKIQKDLGGSLTVGGQGPSGAPPTGQVGRPPLLTITRRLMGGSWQSGTGVGAERGRRGWKAGSSTARTEPKKESRAGTSPDPAVG